MVGAAQPDSARWGDLARRIVSAVILLAIGVAIAVSSGIWLHLAIAIMVGITFWELARLTGYRHPDLHATLFGRKRGLALAALGGLAVFVGVSYAAQFWLIVLFIPILAGLPGAMGQERVPYVIFGLAVLIAGAELVVLREAAGLALIGWLIGVVMISDILGYFAGRILGGPKFWPRLSPKKTWSGTVAGWIGAALFGAALWLGGLGPVTLIWLSPLVALAGQLGDIAESWLKRRAGVKDSSNLIPGHGGFLDRFDAVIGAALAVSLLDLFGVLPLIGG